MRRVHVLSSIVLVAFGCAGSTDGPTPPRIPARIVLSGNSVTTYPGVNIALPTATVYDSADQTLAVRVYWTTGDSSIARIANDGLAASSVYGVVVGTSTATASVSGAAPTAVAQVRVVREPVVSVVTNIDGRALYGNDSLQVVAEAHGPAGDIIANRVVTLTALTPEIATISAAGLVHIHSSGTAKILAASEGVVDTATFLVDSRRVARIVVTADSLTLVAGEEYDHLRYHAVDAQGNMLNRLVTVTSANDSVATYDDYFQELDAGIPGSTVLTFQSDTATTHVYVTVNPR